MYYVPVSDLFVVLDLFLQVSAHLKLDETEDVKKKLVTQCTESST